MVLYRLAFESEKTVTTVIRSNRMKLRQALFSFGTLILNQELAVKSLVSGSEDVVSYVNTLIGTSYYEDQFDVHDYGNTAPFAGPPFAHTPWTAQTRDSEDKCKSPYYYFDENWQGMRRSHWMSGSCTIDYGSATIIPSISGDLKEALTFHRMDHTAEKSTPAYYRMNLIESSMIVEASSDLRSGIIKVTPSDEHKFFYLIFKASDTMYNQSSVNIIAAASNTTETITALVDSLTISSPVHRWYQSKGEHAKFSGHHYFKSSRPACEFGIIDNYTHIRKGQYSGISNSKGTVAAYLKFESSQGDVTVATGTSFVSVEKAKENLYAELDISSGQTQESIEQSSAITCDFNEHNKSFDGKDSIFDLHRLVAKITSIWSERLGVFKAVPFVTENADSNLTPEKGEKRDLRPGGQNLSGSSSMDQLITFYSALWHTQLLPRIVSDFDGQYLSFGDNVRTVQVTDPQGGFTNYFDDFSMWDIFRAQIPLFNLVYTDHTRDMVTSLLKKAESGGWLPIFPAWNSYTDEMIGDHCTVLIADSFLKGILSTSNGTLFADSYEYLVKNAMQMPSDVEYKMGMGRRALHSYVQYGFIPLEDEVLDSPHPRQQVSRTLEYSYDDYVVSQMAALYSKFLLEIIDEESLRIGIVDPSVPSSEYGRDVKAMVTALKGSESVAQHLLERSQSFRWVVDGDTSHEWYRNKVNDGAVRDGEKSVYFVRGRYANHSWTQTFDSFDPATYYTWLTETNVWQYSFSVLHDVEALIQIYGGEKTFIEKLDKFFDDSWYNHGNEPDHHALFLYAYVPGSAWRIQDRLPEIVRTQYGPLERSMSGNDDAGQMSAWLVLSSMGLYQVCPGCGGRSEYVFGLPLFAHMEVVLPSVESHCVDGVDTHTQSRCTAIGATPHTVLVLDTIRLNNATTDKYVQMVTWNGCTYDCAFFPHSMISGGGQLVAHLGPEPNKSWGGNGRKCMDAFIYPGDSGSENIGGGKIRTC